MGKEMKRKGGVTHGRERRRSNEDLATPARERPSAEGTLASRGAKSKAMSKLQDNALDMAQYQKERKRKGGDVKDEGTEKAPRGKKRQSIEIEEEETKEEEEEEEEVSAVSTKNGKRRKSENEPTTNRLVLTSYPRWQDNPKLEPAERNTLRNPH